MNLMDAILGAKSSPLKKIAGQFGLSEDAASQVVKQLLPALTNGMKKNVSEKKGLDGLLNALNKGNHESYLDDESAFESDQAISDGNSILSHLLKSKDTSRQLAKKTAESTGQDYGMIKKMLPMVAGLAMGAMKKQSSQSGLLSNLSKGETSSMNSLMGLLDADGDGSPIDDILGFAKKFF